MSLEQIKVRTREPGESVERIVDEMNVSETMARILDSRGVKSVQDTTYSIRDLEHPSQMPDIDQAANRIVEAIDDLEEIFICGDFDADGATATAVCLLFFRAIGFHHVDFRMPDRFRFGYGLSEAFVRSILNDGANLLITVDNGVSSVDGVALANEHDIDVIVTDHHIPPEEERLPQAHSIVNPKMHNSQFPSEPCGCGVVFYLLAAVRAKLIETGYFEEYEIEPPNMAQWLDLVAVGTVVDMVPLDLNNRRLVNSGLQRMRAGDMRPGLRALCEVSKTSISSIGTQDLGFKLGPRINAAGRLDDISVGVQLLTTDNNEEARSLARELQTLNTNRRNIQITMNTKAHEELSLLSDEERKSLCVYHPDFHEGVVGLVATRLVEATAAPAIVFADAKNTEPPELKGSARSVAGVHIRDVLAYVESRHPKLILRYGGHAAAAGMSLYKGNFERFKSLFDDAVVTLASADAFDGIVYTDGELHENDINLDFVNEIERFEPWGNEFERPMFHGVFDIVAQRTIGRDRNHLKLTLQVGQKCVQAISFNQEYLDADRIEMLYRLERNEYAGISTVQMIADKIVEVA